MPKCNGYAYCEFQLVNWTMVRTSCYPEQFNHQCQVPYQPNFWRGQLFILDTDYQTYLLTYSCLMLNEHTIVHSETLHQIGDRLPVPVLSVPTMTEQHR
ncbi:unnamed protein product [Oppiella nova]|uniref:Uncharacterized protein n=1 Tax=Oppiella nova TaxID=334625 RepID=A0A7R9MGI9_9ACAR|nr:unnamed protein product [Oppiella nova]CAG2176972.1 unnamed protein product [Oppiella nova]